MSYTNSHALADHYRKVDTYTAVGAADSHQLVLMLMDGALDKIAMAKGFMERRQIAPKGASIGQAISIINGLRASLDMDAGGEIAANLDALYEYMERRLTEGHARNDSTILDEVSRLLGEIRSAWVEMPWKERTAVAVGATAHV